MRTTLAFCLLAAGLLPAADSIPPPGARVLMDAHNCYPYDGRWTDRIDRAMSAGTPLAIEQDLFWYRDPATGRFRSLVTHGKPVNGTEPGMEQYFFEKIRPIMERALREGNHGDWPLITLNLDFKTDEAAHHAAVWKLLGKYESWLCTAERSRNPSEVTPIHPGPLLVLTGQQDSQQRDFWRKVPAGGRLRLFGAVHSLSRETSTPVKQVIDHGATNYRRWWNNPWSVVEEGGQQKAGDWTDADYDRLKALVDYAHARGLYIRFYTLDGGPAALFQQNGWIEEYNFGSHTAAELRWKAARRAGVDYIATDLYEDLGKILREGN
jgi:hypothetical protein